MTETALEELVFIMQSGHWDMEVVQLESALDYFFKVEKADVVQYTEVSPDKFYWPIRHYCHKNNLHLHHPKRPGADECMTVSRVKITQRRSHQATEFKLPHGRTAPTFLLSTKLAGWGKFRVLHTPAHTGGLRKTGKFAAWTRVYYSVLDFLARKIRNTAGMQTFSADVNLDMHLEKNYELFAEYFAGLTYAGRQKQYGDLGHRLITATWTNHVVHKRSETLSPRRPGHDHAPVKTILGKAHA
jgi:hypothetical protein